MINLIKVKIFQITFRLYKILAYSMHFMVNIYLCTFLCVYILLLLSWCSLYNRVLRIVPVSFYINHTT